MNGWQHHWRLEYTWAPRCLQQAEGRLLKRLVGNILLATSE